MASPCSTPPDVRTIFGGSCPGAVRLNRLKIATAEISFKKTFVVISSPESDREESLRAGCNYTQTLLKGKPDFNVRVKIFI
jgi:hypothetical protein